jgi:hypothetical protein
MEIAGDSTVRCRSRWIAIRRVSLAPIAVFISLVAAEAEEAIRFGEAYALLNRPGQVRAIAILIPGGDGNMQIRPDGRFSGLAGNQLVRTRAAYADFGIATITIDREVAVGAAVRHARQIARPVVVVATSRGSLRAAQALADDPEGAPEGLVLTAAYLLPGTADNSVQALVQIPTRLPPTLVLHHRKDECGETPPSATAPFRHWAGERVRIVMLEGGATGGAPCQPHSPHGFWGLDQAVVRQIADFILSLRALTND